MTTSHQNKEFEVEIEAMLEKVFRIIHEGVILHEYLTDKEYATLAVTLKNISPPLRGLRISQCTKEPLNTHVLTQLIQGNNTLEWLHLEANKIDPTGIKAVAEILKHNNKLQQLNCDFVVDGLSAEDVQAIADMLLVNTTLKELILRANCINVEKIKVVANTLAQNPALEKLDLAANELGEEGAAALADALTKNSKLRELNVSDCRLGTKGIKTIFSALKQNTGLQTLIFRRLGADAMQALSEMLTENKALRKLDLSLYTSEFTLEQMQSLLEALRKNKTLQELNIQDDDGKLKNEISEIKQILMQNLTPLEPQEPAAAPEAVTPPEDAKQPQTAGTGAAGTPAAGAAAKQPEAEKKVAATK